MLENEIFLKSYFLEDLKNVAITTRKNDTTDSQNPSGMVKICG